MKEKLDIIKSTKDANHYSNYIEHIRFPNYKKLEPNTRINLDFPITFLVGKNGSGKSSILHALFGCPEGKVISEFWFETDLDPILDHATRNRYIYGYKSGNEVKEVLYQRSPRTGNPDYWETSRPVISLGMIPEPQGARVPPIVMDVLYLDFRSELNAFDKYFHFSTYKPQRFNKKQDFLRFFSKKLRKALDNTSIERYYSQTNEPKIVLQNNLIQSINSILSKNYTSIEIIKHNFYRDWGYTIRIIDADLRYSEAFAGSGESSIILMIYQISQLGNNSLIILDEPETSLHPGAQQKLVNFLLDQTIQKKHQIIISTHSREVINKMPDNAIKVIYTNSNNRFEILNSCNYRFAFSELGVTEQSKTLVLCEDLLAKKIIEAVLRDLNYNFNEVFIVQVSSGGSKEIYKRIVQLMDLERNIFVLFDGDEAKPDVIVNINDFTVEQSNSLDFVSNKILEKTSVNITELKFSINSGDTVSQKLIKSKEYLNFLHNKVKYLPLMTPEDIIWDETYAKDRITLLKGMENHVFEQSNSKDKIYQYNIIIHENTSNYEAILDEFILIWKKKSDENYHIIKDILSNLITI